MYRLSIVLTAVLLLGCKAVPKFRLPTEGTPERVTYVREIATSLPKEQNYENLLREIFIVSPEAKMINTDKAGGNLEVICRSFYHLDGKERKVDFVLSCTFGPDKAVLKIYGINILHVYLEKYYLDDRRHTTKKFNPVYEELNGICLSMLETFSRQLK
jgi:hypothetical protein